MKRRFAEGKAPPTTRTDYEWILEDIEPGASAEWHMSASPPGYYLEAVKMKEDFLALQSPDSPRISWAVHRDKNDYLTLIIGGQAPTWQVAQARAEAIWRVVANIRAEA